MEHRLLNGWHALLVTSPFVIFTLQSNSVGQSSPSYFKPYAAPADSSFQLILNFADVDSGIMVLSYESKTGKRSDTAMRNEYGVFIFNGSLNEPQSLSLFFVVSRDTSQNELFMENNRLEVSGRWHDRQSWVWKGSKVPADYDEYQQMTRKISAAIDSTDSLIAAFQGSNMDDESRCLSRRIDTLFSEKRGMTTAFIASHPYSPVSLNQLILNFYARATATEMQEAWDLLDTSIQNMPDGKFFFKELLTPALNTDVGKIAPEILLPDKDGKVVALSSLGGRYVLIDFWASWCVPCRKSIPELRRLYLKYRDRFEIFSVSLDEERSPWLGAMHELGLTWASVGDIKGFQSPVALTYGVKAIPLAILIDRNGRILSRNPSISDMEQILSDND